MDHDVEFCIPWNYSYVVVSDEEKRFQELVRQKDLEIDMKFQNLEKTIEMKNREVISAVKSIIDNVGGAEKEGDIYIHSSGDSVDAAGLKGRNHNQGGLRTMKYVCRSCWSRLQHGKCHLQEQTHRCSDSQQLGHLCPVFILG